MSKAPPWSFDAIARTHDPKARLIALECVECEKSGADVFLRKNMFRDAEAVLCQACWYKWC